MSPPESLTTICAGFAGSAWPHATRGNAAAMPPSASSDRRVRWNLVIAESSSLFERRPTPGSVLRSREPARFDAIVRRKRRMRRAGEQVLRDLLGRRLRKPIDVRDVARHLEPREAQLAVRHDLQRRNVLPA